LFDCNYRGDYVTQAQKKNRGARRRSSSAEGTTGSVDLSQLTDLKHSVCPKFIIRLEADKVPLSFYEEQAIKRGVPLTTGIGASQIDRNSLPDLDIAKQEIHETADQFVSAIKQVSENISLQEDNSVLEPWPSHVYFEDISNQSQFDMIEIIIQSVRDNGQFKGRD
jgi:hypothetical protein